MQFQVCWLDNMDPQLTVMCDLAHRNLQHKGNPLDQRTTCCPRPAGQPMEQRRQALIPRTHG